MSEKLKDAIKKTLRNVNGKFNLFHEGRNYTGHHRRYILENARAIAESPETMEGIRLREKLGYLGHGRRQLARKLNLGEVEPVKLPDGRTIIVENVPCCVTTDFKVHENGDVEHKQEVLETAPGKVVAGLIDSKVGGWSWACDGTDGGALSPTKLSRFYGFDYVYQPGFAENRSYPILESADGGVRDIILENVGKLGVTDRDADRYLEHWIASEAIRAQELENRLEQSAIYEDSLREEVEKRENEIEVLRQADEAKKKVIYEAARQMTIVPPDNVLDAILSMADENDFQKMVGFFEQAMSADVKHLPLWGNQSAEVKMPQVIKKEGQFRGGIASDMEYGDVGLAVDNW